jgi:hypothetical protein
MTYGFVSFVRNGLIVAILPDGTSEFADVSCGDPWYREIKEGEQGHSLVLVRTEKGRKILHNALKAGYVVLKEASPGILEGSQKNLLAKRGAIGGRLVSMKLLMVPTPRLRGFSLLKNWLAIPLIGNFALCWARPAGLSNAVIISPSNNPFIILINLDITDKLCRNMALQLCRVCVDGIAETAKHLVSTGIKSR